MPSKVEFNEMMRVVNGMGESSLIQDEALQRGDSDDIGRSAIIGYEDRNIEGDVNRDDIMAVLTPRQREVVDLLASGLSRIDVANALVPPVSLQSIHQIILRIRKSIKSNGIRRDRAR